jgi:hypothetical protein
VDAERHRAPPARVLTRTRHARILLPRIHCCSIRTRCTQNFAGFTIIQGKTEIFPLFDFLRPGSAQVGQHKFYCIVCAMCIVCAHGVSCVQTMHYNLCWSTRSRCAGGPAQILVYRVRLIQAHTCIEKFAGSSADLFL